MSVKERLEDYLKGYQSQYNFVGEDKIEHTLDNDIKSLLEENELLKRNCNIGNDSLKFYREQYENLITYKEEHIYILQENADLQQRIDKAINDILTTFQIISEQPSRNVEEDNYILSRLEGFIKILGGDVDDE